MYVPDANLVLTLLKAKGKTRLLPPAYQQYLAITRRQVGVHWQERKRYIPVDATLAAVELSQSGSRALNRSKFEEYFYDYIKVVHGIFNVAPEWVDGFFEPLSRGIASQLPSLAAVFEKALQLIPPGDTASDAQVEAACDELFGWLISQKNELSLIGGPSLYASVYAIAGSPDARRVLKVHEARKTGPNAVAWNVAWDFMYLHHMDNLHIHQKYDHNIFCTADGALATLMASRTHTGPKYCPDTVSATGSIESHWELEPFKFRKLDGTKLSRRIAEKYGETMIEIASTTRDVITVGF